MDNESPFAGPPFSVADVEDPVDVGAVAEDSSGYAHYKAEMQALLREKVWGTIQVTGSPTAIYMDRGASAAHWRVQFARRLAQELPDPNGRVLEVITPGAAVGSTAGTQAGNDALKLTEDMLALKKTIEIAENHAKIVAADPAFITSYEQMLQGWQRFTQQASGADIPWYNLPAKATRSLWAVFEGTSLFNTTQDYRKKFNDHYARVQEILGRQPTPSAPEAPKARKVDNSPTEALGGALDKLVSGAILVGGIGVGGWFVLRLMKK